MPLRVILLMLVVPALLFDAVEADAQGFRRPAERQKPMTEPFAADGSVVAIAPGRVQMHTLSNQDWMVWIAPEAVIHVLGKAESDFVRAGMCVRFTADIDKNGKTQEPVGQLGLFTPSPDAPIGIWPEGMTPGEEGPQPPNCPMGQGAPQAGMQGGMGRGMGSGVENRMGGGMQGNGFADNPNQPVPAVSRYTVAGQITRERNGRFTINCGCALVEFQLTEQPEIKVDIADYSVVKPSDRISVTKGKMFPGQMGIAQAQELTFELAEPLTLGKKKPARTNRPRTTRTRPSGPQQPFEVEGASE